MSRQTLFRTGGVAAAGKGRPFNPKTKSFNSVVTGGFVPNINTSLSGQVWVWCPNTYNFPLEDLATTHGAGSTPTSGTSNITLDDTYVHPTGHEECIAMLYTEAEVTSAYYRMSFSWRGTENPQEDCIFAYKFSNEAVVSDYDFTIANTVARHQWHHMRMTKGWVWKRFSATQAGGSIYPSAGVIEIRIPKVRELAYGLHKHTFEASGEALQGSMYTHTIADGTTVHLPEFPIYLHCMVFTQAGTHATQVEDWVIDVDLFQNVKTSRNNTGNAIMIDEPDAGNTVGYVDHS